MQVDESNGSRQQPLQQRAPDGDVHMEEDVSRMTYIQAPKDEPANLDMSSFDKPNESQASDSLKKDFEI